jgi:PhzF family phenazine biosynthesis protein
MAALPIFIVDAFTDKPFAGNPAAVCLLRDKPSDTWMQQLAAEMNLSETAYLLPEKDTYGLRWFTPTTEVDLCGHATLASAHVLWETGKLQANQHARFITRCGQLTVERTGRGMNMDFPAYPAQPCKTVNDLPSALGAKPIFLGKSEMDYLIVVESEQELRSIRPDFTRLLQYPVRGFIVTARADDPSYDFVSRFFAPSHGVLEDPVCGSAHCCLGPYWSSQLDKQDLVGYQASARGGVVHVGVRGSRVQLGGQAVTVVRGEVCR